MSVIKPKLIIMISGNGSNLQAIIDSCHTGKLNASIELIISNNSDAYGLVRAKEAGINAEILEANPGEAKEHYDQRLINLIESTVPDVSLICLAGFMRILSSHIINKYPNKIINIHPSLLPAFKGMNAQKQAIDAGAVVSGCTVHYVTEGIDDGPIIAQEALAILPNETAEQYAARLLEVEHRLYVKAIQSLLKLDKLYKY